MLAQTKPGGKQPGTLVPTKTKQIELVMSKFSTTAIQGIEGAAKALPLVGDPSTNAPPTTLASFAPTPTLEVQTTTKTEA